MSTLTQRISHLSSNKRALLEALLKEKGVPLSRSLIVPRQRNSNSAPLSFAQQRLWFLHQLEPESSSYNVGIACRIRGSLDPVVLEKVFNEIFRRHDVFRTTFHDR